MSNLQAIKKTLLERKVELEGALSRLYKEKKVEDVEDSGDQALSSSLEELKISLHNTEQDEYQMILKALEMIEEGTYGICLDCAKPISERRLHLFPNSTRCLVCQEAWEVSGLS